LQEALPALPELAEELTQKVETAAAIYDEALADDAGA
jgi:hypothetical protein